jgi:hypothetical protein
LGITRPSQRFPAGWDVTSWARDTFVQAIDAPLRPAAAATKMDPHLRRSKRGKGGCARSSSQTKRGPTLTSLMPCNMRKLGRDSPVVDSRVGPVLEIAPNTLRVSIRVSNTWFYLYITVMKNKGTHKRQFNMKQVSAYILL